MSYVVVRDYVQDDIASNPSLNPEGEVYDWWMVDSRRPEYVIYADTYHDLAKVLCRDNLEGSPEENMDALINAGMEATKSLKKQLKDVINSEPITVPQWEAEIIVASLANPEACIYGWGDGNKDFIVEPIPSKKSETRDIWDSQVPLILFELHYAPYTELQYPLSGYGEAIHPANIKWVRVSSEYSFIDSLYVAGLIDFGRTLE